MKQGDSEILILILLDWKVVHWPQVDQHRNEWSLMYNIVSDHVCTHLIETARLLKQRIPLTKINRTEYDNGPSIKYFQLQGREGFKKVWQFL